MDSRYKNGKIYKLVCDATPIVYYGSTIISLSNRLSNHKSNKDCCSRELFDAGNVSIELIEQYPCNNKYELWARERIYIEFMLNNFTHRVICNKSIPNRTYKEYYQASKEYWAERRRERENEKFNCDCGGRYTRGHKAQHLRSKKHQNYINSLGIE